MSMLKDSPYFMISMMIVLSCSSTGFPDRSTVDLDRNIGSVSLNIPSVFDRYQKHFKPSDCGCCCDMVLYRFSNSDLDSFPVQDTLPHIFRSPNEYSITISHGACNCSSSDKTFSHETELNDHVEALLAENSRTDIVIDQVEVLEDRKFVIIGYRTGSRQVLSASTFVGSEGIHLLFQSTYSDSLDFIHEMYDVIKTIKIQPA